MSRSQPDFADEHLARWRDLFPDPDRRDALIEGALVRMGDLMRRNERGLRALADEALGFEDFTTLHALIGGRHRGTPATPAELADRTGVTRAGMTSRLDRLVAAGLVTREPDQQDRRRVLVTATTAGQAAWQQRLQAWQEVESSQFAALTDEQLRRLNALLRSLSPADRKS